MKEIHVGTIIKKKIKEKGMKITDFAIALNCTRNNAYSIFDRENIDLKLLTTISKILDYNFLEEIQNNNSNSKHIILIEVDNSKMKEIQSDSQIKVHYSKNV